MAKHIIFVAPFFMDATLRFLRGATHLADTHLTLVSQDPLEKLPADLQQRLTGHWQVGNALDPNHLVQAAQGLQQKFGPAERLIGPLEQLQVPLAVARESLGMDGLSAEAAYNFRDKARMKTVLRQAGVPCAQHALAGQANEAFDFAQEAGFPLVVKPPAGAGGKSTWRIDNEHQLAELLQRHLPQHGQPMLLEEFVRGTEYSFDSVMINGEMVWHSISHYLPSPLDVCVPPVALVDTRQHCSKPPARRW